MVIEGESKIINVRNYQCKNCGRQFIDNYSALGYPKKVREDCLKMYLNGNGFRAIERITQVNHNTVIRWVKQVGNQLPDNSSDNKIPQVAQLVRHYLARLHRKTFCYSKSKEMLFLSIKLLIYYLKKKNISSII
jgi:hypothetical protein